MAGRVREIVRSSLHPANFVDESMSRDDDDHKSVCGGGSRVILSIDMAGV